MNLPMSCSSAGGVDEVLLVARAAGIARDLAGVARDGGGVARGHLVARVEEVEDDPNEAVALGLRVGGELAGGLGVALGLEQVALQARVGDEQDAGERDDGGADGRNQVDEDGGREGECQVGRDQRPGALRQLAVHARALSHQR